MMMMVSCNPELHVHVLSERNPIRSSQSHTSRPVVITRHRHLGRRRRFYPHSESSQTKAIFFLRNCTNFTHLRIIHAKIIRNGILPQSFSSSPDQQAHLHLLVRKLLHLCFSVGKMVYASRILFHQILVDTHRHSHPHGHSGTGCIDIDTFTWNFMIRAYTKHGNPLQALILYNLIVCRGFPPPDKFTFPFIVKSCLAASAIHKAREVHGLAIKAGFSKDTFLLNTLMDLYLKSGDVDSGRKVFDKMRVRTVVTWTTFVNGLVACGELDAARRAFDQMSTRNVISWTAMINGYVRNHRAEEAFELFSRMQLYNVKPNELTMVSLLKASTQLGSLNLGRRIHEYAIKNGSLLGPYLGTALIDMYSKCGSLSDAREVFDKMEMKTLATWNVMITSLGVHGCGKEALALFAQMEEAKVEPDAITFVGVLCACVQTNDVKEGYRYFTHMRKRYGIAPIQEHYTCMIELYSRANTSNELRELFDKRVARII